MTKRLGILILTVLCLLSAVTFWSCSGNDEPEVPVGPDTSGNTICFKFKIYTDDVASQSRSLGVWEEDYANVAERILSPDDMRVLILSGSGFLIRSVKPSYLVYNKSGISGDGYYDLSIFFEDDFLDRYDDNSIIPLQVLVLANMNSIGGFYSSDALLTGSDIDKVQETFVMSPDWFPSESGGIPMYGLNNSIRILKSDIMSGGEAPAGTIHMLRAMSKIEVFDDIMNAYIADDGKKYPRISRVEMTSWRNHGYLKVPYIDYYNGLRSGIIHPEGFTATPVQATYIEEDNVFRFYCPEAKLAEMGFRVYAIVGPDGNEKAYDVSLDQYADDGTEFGTDLVRNHIYRFKVRAVNTIADIDVSVADWGHKVDEYELGNVVSMDANGFLQWQNLSSDFSETSTTYNGKPERQLSMLNGTTGYATGTFHIVSPQGATWRAYFIPGENGVDAFEFVDVDAAGNVVDGSAGIYVEGKVGEPATIHIRGKGPADIYRHTAELVVEVRTADGSILHAPLTSAMSPRFIIYRENRL